MQDELKQVISQAMDTNSEFQQELTEQIAEGELSDEALETVAGGIFCLHRTIHKPCKFFQSRIPLTIKF